MPAGDVWGNSWGDSWNAYWKQATVAVEETSGRGGHPVGIYWQDFPRRKSGKSRTEELLDQLERSMREVVYGPTGEPPIPIKDLAVLLAEAQALAEPVLEIQERIASLEAQIAAIHEAKLFEILQDDEEVLLLI